MVITVIVLGTGDRGTIYAQYALDHPQEVSVIAAADPDEGRMRQFRQRHGLTSESCYDDWMLVLQQDKFADAVIVALPDELHYHAATEALKKGYHVMLEKPIGTNLDEINQLVRIAKQSQGILQVCHVLRYTSFYQKVKEICTSGRIGDIVTITMRENVSYYHYAHSYIRGNWHSREKTAPMILTKSSHDLDLMYWLAESDPSYISSFGNLRFFGPDNRPDGSPDRCTDGCPVAEECLYYAPRIYLDILPLLYGNMQHGSKIENTMIKLAIKYPKLKQFPPFNQINKYQGWPVNILTENPTIENRQKALENGPYGRCVYDIDDHDVIDNQVVNVVFSNGITVNFTLHGHSSEEGRQIRIDGTRGTLVGEFSFRGNHLHIIDSLTNEKEKLIDGETNEGHGGGDLGVMKDFISNIQEGRQPMTNGSVSLISHVMAFAADKSRLTNETIQMSDYIRSI